MLYFFFFFFSSRRLHTTSYGDWSSDVCSSDLPHRRAGLLTERAQEATPAFGEHRRRRSDDGGATESLEVLFCNLHQPGKGTAVAHGQVSQHLAVDLHSGLAKAVHQFVVRQPRLPRGCVDARDPEPAHLSLAAAAVAVRVGKGMQDRLVGGPEEKLLGKPEPFGALEDRLV